MAEEQEKIMYSKEEIEEIKKGHSRDQKMDFMIDQIHENAEAIEEVKDTLHNGWDRQIWMNTWFRRGSLWLIGGVLLSGVGYLFTMI